ncbi:MAG: adenosine kinase [Gammaproteobacteria bacterium]|nr:adenosine kinase [Gammaproteobacteria bacterium]MAY03011.1 adenosine kinase [Gammaproteobacteria bacterium]|tara:strand:- start:647 stop:1645 length:999 start_codon:yes stop_codon:yes gene_type:complete
MKKYHIYALGNALVDKEFEVDDSFFTHESLQKGIMTLVDEDSHETIFERLMKKYGLKKRAGGGSAANTLYAASQFGANTFYSCKVANDEFGDFYLQELGNHNIDTNLDSIRGEEGVTGKCLVMVSPDAERTMLTYLGVSENLTATDIHEDALANSKYLYLEGYLVSSDSARVACVKAREIAEKNGVKTALTLSDPAMVQFYRGGLEDMIGDGVDLLFANKVEAQTWTGEDDIDAVVEALKKITKTLVITLGSEGALVFDGETTTKIDSYPVKAVDSNGAGDMFAGAFLYGISSGQDFATAGRLASMSAAAVVSQFGPRLPAEQHQELLNKVS